MILLRYIDAESSASHALVFATISHGLSDIALEKRTLKTIGKTFAVRSTRTTHVTSDNRVGKRIIVEFKGPKGFKIHEWLNDSELAVGPLNYKGADFNLVEIDDRLDFPELWISPPKCKYAQHTFDLLKTRCLIGEIKPKTILSAAKIIEMAYQWGAKPTEEMIGLLFGRSRGPRVADLTVFEIKSYTTLDADAVCWEKLIKEFINKKWHHQFSCFADVGLRCGLPSRPAGRKRLHPYIPPRLQRKGLALDPAPWLLHPVRERILEYAENPEIALDEFLDLAAFRPPQGYNVLRRLSNTSAFKIVYKAQTERRMVALKRYKRWDDNLMKGILARLRLTKDQVLEKDTITHWMGLIRHLHILPCATVKNEEGELFIVEPLLDNTLDKVTHLSLRDLTQLVYEACEGLVFLHQTNWIHSDIKPDNIGIERGRAVLLDFGIASFYSPGQRPRNNPGSLKTRAPELFSNTAIPTFKSDVWAMGATLMALISGGEYPLVTRDELEKLPPAGNPNRADFERTISSRIEKYQRNPQKLENRICAALPHIFRDAVLRACQFAPERRPNSTDLVTLVGRILEKL